MTHVPTHLAAIVLLFAAFYGAGAAIAFVLPPLGIRLEWRPLVLIVLGITGWLVVLFLCAVFHRLDRASLVVGAVATATFGVVDASRHARGYSTAVHAVASDPLPANVALAALTAPAIVFVALLLISLTPYIGWDDSVAHLTLPRIFLAHDGFVRVPFNVYSNWPLNPQLLYAFAMLVDDYIVAKLVHLTFLGLTAFAVYRLTSASSRLAGVIAVMLLLANPVVLDEARSAYIDLAFAFFLLMAFICALQYLDERRTMPLVLSGVCCGLVAGTKLTGAIAAPCIGLLVIGSRVAPNKWNELRSACIDALLYLALPAAILAAPWYVRSYVYTGNPFYPLFFERLGGPEWNSDLNRQFIDWQQSIGMGRGLLDYAALPFRVALYGGDDYAHFDGRINPLWAVLVPFTLTAFRASPLVRRSLAIAALYFIVWAATSQQARFLIPILPLLAVAAGVAVALALERVVPGRSAAIAFVAVLMGLAVLLDARFVVMDGVRAARIVLASRLDVPGDARNDVEQFISERLPANARLMLLNTNQGFFIDRDYVADSFFEASQLNALVLQGNGGAAGISRRLRGMSITHVLLARRDWGIPYPPALADFLNNPGLSELIYTSADAEYRLYTVRGPSGPATAE